MRVGRMAKETAPLSRTLCAHKLSISERLFWNPWRDILPGIPKNWANATCASPKDTLALFNIHTPNVPPGTPFQGNRGVHTKSPIWRIVSDRILDPLGVETARFNPGSPSIECTGLVFGVHASPMSKWESSKRGIIERIFLTILKMIVKRSLSKGSSKRSLSKGLSKGSSKGSSKKTLVMGFCQKDSRKRLS